MELLNIKGAKMFKKIAVVADHRGEDYKKFVVDALKSNNIDYTRYSDDMTFSGDFNPTEVIQKVRKMLYRLNLKINTNQ